MERIMRYMLTILGVLAGYPLALYLMSSPELVNLLPVHNNLIIYIIVMIATGLIVFFIYPIFLSILRKLTADLERRLRSRNILEILFQITGFIIGLIIAFLISSAFNSYPIPGLQWLISISLYLVLGYIGWTVPTYKGNELTGFTNRFRRSEKSVEIVNKTEDETDVHSVRKPKVLDTSVIIDGRIIDIFKTQFMEGPLIIPTYVLSELQLISDSSDDLKRSKGRRGLDIVAKLQDSFKDDVIILEEDYTELKDVDSKLIKTAKDRDYKIVTNDYNLNKVASLQGIDILNINDLANAVKISVLPGEVIDVSLIKAGKEPGQAVAYMEDGTMIVVENSKHLIGKNLPVIVTSALQTSAGRMIFAKPTGDYNEAYT